MPLAGSHVESLHSREPSLEEIFLHHYDVLATVAASPDTGFARARGGVFPALVRRALRDSRTRVIGFVYVFVAVSYIQPVAYRHTYPTVAQRLGFAHSFGHNKAVVLFYGKAYDLLTVGGYSAWRVGGTLAIFAAVFGMLAAVRALRAEEDAGRAELVLAAPVARRTVYAASLTAIAFGSAVLWLALRRPCSRAGFRPPAARISRSPSRR